MKWLKPAQGEPRLAGLVDLGPVSSQRLVRQHILIQPEAHAQLLGQAVCAVQGADLIPAYNPPGLSAVRYDGLQPELLRLDFLPKLAAELAALAGHRDLVAPGSALLQLHHSASAQIDITPHLVRRQTLKFRGIRPDDNHLRQALGRSEEHTSE